MADPTTMIALASASIAGVGILSMASLRGWREWLEVKRVELGAAGRATAGPSPAARIEIADLKERVRKLEAIAAGIDI